MFVASLTHEVDLDGLGSQAIIRRYFQTKRDVHSENIKLFYAHYTNFKKRVKKILDTFKPDFFIITDIGFNEDFTEIFPFFKDSIKNGCKLYWFDHHLVDKEYAKELMELIELYYNDFQKCSAEIVKDFYLPNDNIAKKIAAFAHDTDFGKNEFNKASQIQSIISFNRGKKGNIHKKKIVDLLSKGDFENPWFSYQLKKLKKWEKEELCTARINKRVIEIENFGNAVLSYANIGAGKIAKFLKKNYPEQKAYLGIDSRYSELVLYSNYINCREIAKKFSGGGHKDRAGFKYENIIENSSIQKNFLESLKSEIIKNILP